MNKFITSTNVTFFKFKLYFESEPFALKSGDDESMFILLNPSISTNTSSIGNNELTNAMYQG